jgi:DNA-binding beta-propeller fold protein YncE
VPFWAFELRIEHFATIRHSLDYSGGADCELAMRVSVRFGFHHNFTAASSLHKETVLASELLNFPVSHKPRKQFPNPTTSRLRRQGVSEFMKRVRSPLPTLAFGLFLAAGQLLSLNAQEPVPTGKTITPTAAPGSTFHSLNPGLAQFPNFVVGQAVTTATSPDGRTLLILTSGFNLNNDASGNQVNAASTEYVFVFDISVNPPVQKQVLQIPNSFNGMIWAPNTKEFFVSGGPDDDVLVFDFSGGIWTQSATIGLGHANGVGLGANTPMVAGLSVSEDGTRLLAANYRNDSVSLVNLLTRTKIGELDLRPGKINPAQTGTAGGEYPFWTAIKGNGKAYVSSMRDREVVVLDIGGDALSVLKRINVKGQPNKMILNRNQSLLFVANDVTDTVDVINTNSDKVIEEIPILGTGKILDRLQAFKGSNPNSLALSPDEKTLYVTEGGINAVAVIRLAEDRDGDGDRDDRSRVVGLIPTGWYPNSVSTNRTGSLLYVVNGKSNAGPNPQGCRDKAAVAGNSVPCNAANQYVWQLTKAGFSVIPTPKGDTLEGVTERVAKNNGFSLGEAKEESEIISFLHKKIKHIIYVVKENRTYDQILGDLEVGNGDPSIVVFPEATTPNHHQLARQFVTLDNFFDTGEVSGDGWNWSTQAKTTVEVEKTVPVIYAGRGTFTYDYEGTDRNINTGLGTVAARQAANPLNPSDPDILPGTADPSGFDGPNGEEGAGYLWDAALRAHLPVRNYGFFIDLTRYSLPPANPAFIPPTANDPLQGSALGSTVVSFPTKDALQNITDRFFRGYDQKFPDFWRFKEWEREFDQFVAHRNLPALEFYRIVHDHFGSFGTAVDGVNTFAKQMADNDYALGLLVDKVAHSPYRDSTLIFVVEDDAQDGPDHMDAHRSIAYVIGPYVKQGRVVPERFTTVNMLSTIVGILGLKPLGINDATAEAMGDAFGFEKEPWTFNAIVPEVLRSTALPLPPASARNTNSPAHRIPAFIEPNLDNPDYLAQATAGMDFTSEDRVNAVLFNRILWQVMKSDIPYPTQRDQRDLRMNRRQLLETYKPAHETSGGN